MAYTLPVFNIEVGIWHDGSDTGDSPDLLADANFCGGRRTYGGNFFSNKTPREWKATAWLLLPIGTEIVGDSDTVSNLGGDEVEIPIGSGMMYHVIHQERTALGFDNEHVTAIVVKKTAYEHKGPPLPDECVALLTEDGLHIMTEDGICLSPEP